MNDKQIAAIKAIADAIVDAVKAAGSLGAPGGHLYAPLMAHMTSAQFQQFMDALVATGKVTRRGQLYFAE